MTTPSPAQNFDLVHDWHNLLLAWKQAAKGKRGKGPVAAFEVNLAENLLVLQDELVTGTYRPGGYTHFHVHEPKPRLISAAPFRDRVVHHALCNVIEPVFERRFIPDSYANRKGKGTHLACNRFQAFSRHYPYVLRLDIVKHFPSLDHAVLLNILARYLRDDRILALCQIIIDSGAGILDQEHQPWLFPGDDLLALTRPCGLPIGNLTSQFWSNCYLHPLDLFIKRELGCKAYLRYVDDFALFSHSKTQLWEWKLAIREKLASLRLRFHEHSAQVCPVNSGIPWLGFVIYPTHRKLKSRKVVHATRRLHSAYQRWQRGHISFAEFDAMVQGWINHAHYADTWGLRNHVLQHLPLHKPGRTR
jgi:RNA-directed DNA polymerase